MTPGGDGPMTTDVTDGRVDTDLMRKQLEEVGYPPAPAFSLGTITALIDEVDRLRAVAPLVFDVIDRSDGRCIGCDLVDDHHETCDTVPLRAALAELDRLPGGDGGGSQ